MKQDIFNILNQWEFDPNNNIRFVSVNNNREFMQIRLPLGIEQYELNGRPDGKKPYGKITLLEEYQDRLEEVKINNKKFVLSNKDFKELRDEALIFYYRYLILFQIGEYKRTIDDTDHNLRICKLVDEYYQKDDKKQLLQYRPYIIRINSISKSMIAVQDKNVEQAREHLQNGIDTINKLAKVDSDIYVFEKDRSIQNLEEILKQLKSQYPDEKEILEEELNRAVEAENYKLAAEIRDKIRDLKDNGTL
jgi:hypothetical protein